MCGRVVGVGSEVASVSVGDHVVGLGFGAFAGEMVTHEELVAPAPPDIPVSGLATVPSAFVSAALSYELSGLEADDRVLIHAGAGGVGLAAIQLAQAAGAEVFATASAPKQAYLKSLGVKHVFDSRQTNFGKEILDATDGAGVTVVLNSLTSEGFIDASLSCLAQDGRFVELARRDILSEEEMAALRPDVAYDILELDVLKKTDPAWVGRVLRDVVARVAAGELKPIIHSRWPLAEAGAALRFMRSARHLGKIVVTAQPLASGRLREDRTYLVTGGLGGIGLAVAEWLADLGAGTIVLNGRRPPGEDALEAIRALEDRDVTVRVELADVSNDAAVDEMLARMDEELPPLAGVIHSVGVLSRRCADKPGLGPVRNGALAKGSWRLAFAPCDSEPRSRPLRPVFPAASASWAIQARRTMHRRTHSWTSLPVTAGRWDCPARPSPGARGPKSAKRRNRRTGSSGRGPPSAGAGSRHSKALGRLTGSCARTSRHPS